MNSLSLSFRASLVARLDRWKCLLKAFQSSASTAFSALAMVASAWEVSAFIDRTASISPFSNSSDSRARRRRAASSAIFRHCCRRLVTSLNLPPSRAFQVSSRCGAVAERSDPALASSSRILSTLWMASSETLRRRA